MSDRDELARQELANLLCDADTKPPCVPGGAKAVQYEDWRDACRRKGFGGDAKPEARKKAFQRMSEKLQHMQIIGRCDEWVWLASPR